MAARPLLYSMPISHYCISADRMLAFKGVPFDTRYVPYHDKSDLIKATGQDYVPTLVWDLGQEGPRLDAGTLGTPGPRGTGVAVRRHQDPARPP